MSDKKPLLNEPTIERLIREPKIAPISLKQWMRPRKTRRKPKREMRRVVHGKCGSVFEIHARRHVDLRHNFAITLMYLTHASRYRLLQFHGHHGPHRNRLEPPGPDRSVPANVCHIHRITERYQAKVGLVPKIEEDSYAFATEQFHDAESAFEAFLDYCHFQYAGLSYDRHRPILPDDDRT